MQFPLALSEPTTDSVSVRGRGPFVEGGPVVFERRVLDEEQRFDPTESGTVTALDGSVVVTLARTSAGLHLLHFSPC